MPSLLSRLQRLDRSDYVPFPHLSATPVQTAFSTFRASVLTTKQMEPERLLGHSVARTAYYIHFALNVSQAIQLLGWYGIAFLLYSIYPNTK